MTGTKNNKKLTSVQIHRLMGWLEKNKESVLQLGTPELARMAEAELLFEISQSSVYTCRNALGLSREVVKAPPSTKKKMADDIRILALAIEELSACTGCKVQKGVFDIAHPKE